MPLNKKQNKFTVIALSFIILLCVLLKCFTLYRLEFDIDKLDRQIKPIKNYISFNSTVGFDTNMKDDESYELYKAVKYVMAPQAFLYKKNLDTLILIQSKEKETKAFLNYRVIYKSETPESTITLVTKIK